MFLQQGGLSLTWRSIKKAYRRKALELHPDRNLNNINEATQKFAEIQSAYEILSDPQERAWYDSHRDTILAGRDVTEDDIAQTTVRNIRLTSTEEILGLIRQFNASVSFGDEPTGFFSVVREKFNHLALEEEAAATTGVDVLDQPAYPTFGTSNDDYETVVKPFYTAWAGFATKKSFSWKDKYRLSDAPDRRTRRWMEKENKKARDDSVREFNEAVNFLISFVRKRDPRYLPLRSTQAERQKAMRDAAAAQAARARAAHQEKITSFEMPEWARSQDDIDESVELSSTEDEMEVEVLECIVCNKTFKSEKQLEAHERSKKHTKALQLLRRQMKKEGHDLDLGKDIGAMDSPYQSPNKTGGSITPESSGITDHVQSLALDGNGESESNDQPLPANVVSSLSSSTDDDYAPRGDVENRLISERDLSNMLNTFETGMIEPPQDSRATPVVKRGKAKAKRERKAAAGVGYLTYQQEYR